MILSFAVGVFPFPIISGLMEISVLMRSAGNGAYVETTTAQVALSLKKIYDQLYGVGKDGVISPYTIASINIDGEFPVYRISYREQASKSSSNGGTSPPPAELSSSPPHRSTRRSMGHYLSSVVKPNPVPSIVPSSSSSTYISAATTGGGGFGMGMGSVSSTSASSTSGTGAREHVKELWSNTTGTTRSKAGHGHPHPHGQRLKKPRSKEMLNNHSHPHGHTQHSGGVASHGIPTRSRAGTVNSVKSSSARSTSEFSTNGGAGTSHSSNNNNVRVYKGSENVDILAELLGWDRDPDMGFVDEGRSRKDSVASSFSGTGSGGGIDEFGMVENSWDPEEGSSGAAKGKGKDKGIVEKRRLFGDDVLYDEPPE
jgi:hypothetical protein